MSRGRAVEKYYSVPQVAFILEFGEAWVREQLKVGNFGRVLDTDADPAASLVDVSVVLIEGEYRIAASAINRFLEARAFSYTPEIAARNTSELRRKMRLDPVHASGRLN